MFIPMLLASLLGGSGQPALDAELSALRAKYVGKTVWVYGGGPLHCSTVRGSFAELSGPISDPVKIVGLSRHRGTVNRIRRVQPDLVLKNPLLVRVQLPPSFNVRLAVGADLPEMRPPGEADCREFLLPFANETDMLLKFSTTSPSAATKKALAPFLRNPASPPNRLGLTHEQMLWLRGVPDEPQGNLASLLQAPTWTWYGPPGYGDYVFHFKNDRVVKLEEPRPMP